VGPMSCRTRIRLRQISEENRFLLRENKKRVTMEPEPAGSHVDAPECSVPSPPSEPVDTSGISSPLLQGHRRRKTETGPWSPSWFNEATPLIGSLAGRKVAAAGVTMRRVFTTSSAIPEQRSPHDEECSKGSELSLAYSGDDDDESTTTVATTASSVAESVVSLVENFRDGLMIPFVDDKGSHQSIRAGFASLLTAGTVLGIVCEALTHSSGYLSSILGYTYVLNWSICMYPLLFTNLRTQSTTGVSLEFTILNLCGWAFYTTYLSALFFNPHIQQLYMQRFHHGSSVKPNDIAFSVHALLLALVQLGQYFLYNLRDSDKRRKENRRKQVCGLHAETVMLLLVMVIPSSVIPILVMVTPLEFNALDYLYMLSYFKVACTVTKYTKQVWYNFQRQSTAGWNIWYNCLECSGALLSMLQIIVDSIRMGNISGITGNSAKFVLGFATVLFDVSRVREHFKLKA
jgi:cystinosin